MNQIDAQNSGELTDRSVMMTSVTFAGAGLTTCPCCIPWIMVSNDNNVITWERNPYYFKVDAEGNQLPYCDYITNVLVENGEETRQMKCHHRRNRLSARIRHHRQPDPLP